MDLIDLNVRSRQALASLLAIESQHLVPHLVGASVAQALLLEKAASIFTVHGTVVFRLIWMATVFRLVPTFEMLMDVYAASWVFTGGALLIVYLRHMRKVSHA